MIDIFSCLLLIGCAILMIFIMCVKHALYLKKERAYKIAKIVHIGQLDKTASPYINHCMRVGKKLDKNCTIDLVLAGILHDTLEDGNYDVVMELFKEYKIPENTIRIVKILTRKTGESYSSYLERIKASSEATIVKLADLEDNLNLARFYEIGLMPSEKDYNRYRKYINAYFYLHGIRSSFVE